VRDLKLAIAGFGVMRRQGPVKVLAYTVQKTDEKNPTTELWCSKRDRVKDSVVNVVTDLPEVMNNSLDILAAKVLRHSVNVFGDKNKWLQDFHCPFHLDVERVAGVAGVLWAGFRKSLTWKPTKDNITFADVRDFVVKRRRLNVANEDSRINVP